MLVMMIFRFLDNVLVDVQEDVYKSNFVIVVVMLGMNFQYVIVFGLGVMLVDSEGYLWNVKYIIVSGNLLVDFCVNLNVEL